MPRASWSLLIATACGIGVHTESLSAQETASFPRAMPRRLAPADDSWRAAPSGSSSRTRAKSVARAFDPTADDDAADPPARAGKARLPDVTRSDGMRSDRTRLNTTTRGSTAIRAGFSPETDDDDVPAPPRGGTIPEETIYNAPPRTSRLSVSSSPVTSDRATSGRVAPDRAVSGRAVPGRVALGTEEPARRAGDVNRRLTDAAIQTAPPATQYGSPVVSSVVWTLESLQDLALRSNPTLAQAQAGVRRAQGQVTQAGLYPNPTAGYQAAEVGNEGYAGQQGYFIEQEFVTANKLGLSQQVARQEERRAQYGWRAQHLRVVNAVRREFYAVLVAERREELARQLVDVAGQSVKIAEARLKREEGTRVEVLQAKIEQETARQTLVGAENARHAARRRLEAVVGQPLGDAPYAGDPASDIPDLAWDDVWNRVCSGSPVLGAARADARRAQAKVARARVEPIPNVITQSGHAYDTSTEYHISNIQIGVAIPVFNRNQGNIRSAEAEWVQACREVERLERSLQRRLADVYRDYATARGQAERYRDRILPDVNETLTASRKLYEAGELGYLQLQVAQRTYTQTNLQYTEVLGQLWENAVALEGLLLTDGLASPETLDADGR